MKTTTTSKRRRMNPALKNCPFCDKTDHLEILTLTTERPDGSEFIGDAVKCTLCEALAPLIVWQGGSI